MSSTTATPRITSLHIHPPDHGQPMLTLDALDLVAEKGILQDKRYFNRRSRTGGPFKRQVTIIAREQIDSHAATLRLPPFAPGLVRSNIETHGIDLLPLLGKKIQIGTAILLLVEPRTPCEQMERIAPGLRALMQNSQQGLLAQVLQSGSIKPGDKIIPIEHP